LEAKKNLPTLGTNFNPGPPLLGSEGGVVTIPTDLDADPTWMYLITIISDDRTRRQKHLQFESIALS